MVFCGMDWAEDHHDVCLVDAADGVLWRRRIAHDPGGMAELHRAIRDLPRRCCAGEVEELLGTLPDPRTTADIYYLSEQ